jgi:DNA-binding CsgD family transcriptional regulator
MPQIQLQQKLSRSNGHSMHTNAALCGAEFKAIRVQCGYSAREVAEYLCGHAMPATVARSIYRLEQRDQVPGRYVEALQRLVGRKLFNSTLKSIRESALGLKRAEDGFLDIPVRRSSKTERSCNAANHAPTITEEKFFQLLNSLPTNAAPVEWARSFIKAVQKFFEEVDRLSITINLHCDLNDPHDNPIYMATSQIVNAVATDGEIYTVISKTDGSHARRIRENFRQAGFPFHEYYEPHIVECYFADKNYLGVVAFWRKRIHPPFTQHSIERFTALRPFLTFALSYIVARNQQLRPQEELFKQVITGIVDSAGFNDQEIRVVVLLMYGYSYQQIADQLCIALDTVRKHIKNIYRKTNTHSISELFAKYFTPRLWL